MQYSKWLRSLFVHDPAPYRMKRAYLKSLFFWNPIFCPLLSLFCGGFDHLGQRIVTSFLIATIVSNFCFLTIGFVKFANIRLAKWRGHPPRVHAQGWWFSLSLCAMPIGLFIAFKILGMIGGRWGLQSSPVNADDYRVGLLIGTMISGLFFLIGTRAEANEAVKQSRLKMKELENERLKAQISALTAQMNPHLMFNALNTVASLVATDPQKAEDTIVKLSELYRGVLNSSRNMTHSLATELSICEAYLAVEKARFGDRLRAYVEIDAKIDPHATEIPALSIQPLVENAIKHGLSPRAIGGEVRISAVNGEGKIKILVEDNGIGILAAASSLIKKTGAGSGIKNCEDRLKLHYGLEGDFRISERDGGGTKVLMTIPIVARREPVFS